MKSIVSKVAIFGGCHKKGVTSNTSRTPLRFSVFGGVTEFICNNFLYALNVLEALNCKL